MAVIWEVLLVVFLFIGSACPLVLAPLSGYFRDTDQPALDLLLFRILWNFIALTCLGMMVVLGTLTLQFRRRCRGHQFPLQVSPPESGEEGKSCGPYFYHFVRGHHVVVLR